MSIRLIARELYRLKREIEGLEQRVKESPHSRRAPLEDRLRKLRAECRRMENMLEGAKEPPVLRRPR